MLSLLVNFYTPVFRRDVLWYGDVRPSVHPSQFSALFSYMLWHIDLKFCVSLYFYARKIKFECHQFPSLFAGVMLLFNFKLLQICSFPHFSPTCFDILSSNFVYDFVLMYHRASLSVVILLQFLLELCFFVNLKYTKYSFLHFSLTCFDILSWNFAYDFLLLYYRSSSSVVNLRQFLWELCLFWNLEYWKYTVFRTFLLIHPLTYWAERLHITLFFLYYRSSLNVVNLRLFWSYASFRTKNTVNTVFCTFLLHALIYWAEILHMTLFYCTTGQLQVSSMGMNFCRSDVPFGT